MIDAVSRADVLSLEAAQKEFEPAGIYLNTASIGLPPRRAVAALGRRSRRGDGPRGGGGLRRADRPRPPAIRRPRGHTPERVAIGNQVSTFTGLVAARSPTARACWPRRKTSPRSCSRSSPTPIAACGCRPCRWTGLIEAIGPGIDLVAVSAVQSADGRVVPGGLEALASAATGHGCLTYVDATQAVGWLPFDAGRLRLRVLRRVQVAALASRHRLRHGAAGTSGHASASARRLVRRRRSVGSIYGPPLRLARDARRLDISPAWLAWVGTVAALELLGEVGIAAIHRHDVGLANALRRDSAFRRVIRPSSPSTCRRAGTAARGRHQRLLRAGAVRLSFHRSQHRGRRGRRRSRSRPPDLDRRRSIGQWLRSRTRVLRSSLCRR